MKVKKLISTMLALSLVFGSFSALNIASAATKDDSVVLYQTGFDGETTLKEDGWSLEYAHAIRKTASGDETYGNVLEFGLASDVTKEAWPEMYHSILTDKISEIVDGTITLEYDFSLQEYGTPISERNFIYTGFCDAEQRYVKEENNRTTKRYYLVGLDGYKREDGTYSPYIKGMKIAQGLVGTDNYVTDSSWMKIKAVYNMDASTVEFYLDDALLYTWKNDGTVTEPEILKGVFLHGVAAPNAKLWYDNLKVTYDPTPHNIWITEDFDGDNYNDKFVYQRNDGRGKISHETDSADSSNKYLKVTIEEKHNILTMINPIAGGLTVPEDITDGTMIYEFDIKYPSDNPRPSATNYYGTSIWLKTNTAPKLGIIEPNKAYASADNIKTLSNESLDWYTVRVELNAKDKTYNAYANGIKFAENLSYNENFNITDGLMLHDYVPAGYTYYLDNVKVAYIESHVDLAETISVAGVMAVEDKAVINNEDYYSLNENDIDVVLVKGSENAEVTKAITEENGAKTVVVNIKDFPYVNNYTVTVTPEIEGLYIEQTNDILVPDNNWGTMTDATDPLDETNSVKKITSNDPYQGVKTNIQSYIKPSAKFKAYLPETKTGQLIYQFDVLHGDVAADIVFRKKDNAEYTFGAVGYGEKGEWSKKWRTIRIVFDYKTNKVTCWYGGQKLNVDLDFTGMNPLEDGVQIHSWAPVAFSYYVDNVNVAYVENKPQLLTDIQVMGVSVDDFDYKETYHTVGLTQEQYDALEKYKESEQVKFVTAEGVTHSEEIRSTEVDSENNKKTVYIIVNCGKYEKAVYVVNVEVREKNEISTFTATKTETGITASANFVLGNDVTEEGNPYVIIAVYENDRLIGTELVDADEDEDGVATFDLTYNMDATKTYTAKAMLWNMTTLLPLVSAQTVTVE